MPDDMLTIGALARQARRRASSIRYYEQIGLLPEPMRSGGQRRYSRDCLKVLAVIDVAKRAGLSLDQIKAIVAAAPGGGDAVGELRRVAAARLPGAAAELERARQARAWLEKASACQCSSLAECSLFAG
jgi:MerR family transcriptional regulator, redox-sensitive transcriptional activator SoxR